MEIEYLNTAKSRRFTAISRRARFFDLGVLAWLTLFCFARQIKKKRYRMLMPLFPLLAVWVTLLLTTPVFREVRYMFVFHLALPVIAAMLLKPELSLPERNGTDEIPSSENIFYGFE